MDHFNRSVKPNFTDTCRNLAPFLLQNNSNLISSSAEIRQGSLPTSGKRVSLSFCTRMTPRMCESFGGLIERQFSSSARSSRLDDFTGGKIDSGNQKASTRLKGFILGNEISSVSYQSCDPRGSFAPNTFFASSSTNAIHGKPSSKNDNNSLGNR